MKTHIAIFSLVILFSRSITGENTPGITETPFEVRALISDIEQVKTTLSTLNAEFKGSYAFQDYIYHPKDRDFDLNKECVRVRVYQKTNWNQKKVEFAHKLKSEADRSASIKFKKAV